jgi:hypothetical protein
MTTCTTPSSGRVNPASYGRGDSDDVNTITPREVPAP